MTSADLVVAMLESGNGAVLKAYIEQKKNRNMRCNECMADEYRYDAKVGRDWTWKLFDGISVRFERNVSTAQYRKRRER